MNNRKLRTWIAIETICIAYVFSVSGLGAIIGTPENWFLASLLWALIVLTALLARMAISRNNRACTLLQIDQYEESVGSVLYSSGQDELRFTKGLQWNLAYYVLLAFGVLYALSEGLKLLPSSEKQAGSIILFILSCMTLDYGVYMICELQYKLREHRIQLDNSKYYRDGFIENGKFNEERYQTEREADLHFWRDPRITIMLLFATSVGFVLMCFRLWLGFHKLMDVVLQAIHA